MLGHPNSVSVLNEENLFEVGWLHDYYRAVVALREKVLHLYLFLSSFDASIVSTGVYPWFWRDEPQVSCNLHAFVDHVVPVLQQKGNNNKLLSSARIRDTRMSIASFWFDTICEAAYISTIMRWFAEWSEFPSFIPLLIDDYGLTLSQLAVRDARVALPVLYGQLRYLDAIIRRGRSFLFRRHVMCSVLHSSTWCGGCTETLPCWRTQL